MAQDRKITEYQQEFLLEIIGGIATGILTTILFYFLPASQTAGLVFTDRTGTRLDAQVIGHEGFILWPKRVYVALSKNGQPVGVVAVQRGSKK